MNERVNSLFCFFPFSVVVDTEGSSDIPAILSGFSSSLGEAVEANDSMLDSVEGHKSTGLKYLQTKDNIIVTGEME